MQLDRFAQRLGTAVVEKEPPAALGDLRETDAHPHDVLLCIGTGKAFSDQKRLRYEAQQFFLKTAAEMAAAFGDCPDALRNTVRIGERCNVVLPDGQNYLPNFEVPPGFTLDEYFEHVAREGFKQRLPRLQQLAAAGRNPAYPLQ